MDRFDDIWKNRFNEEELPVGDWNAPDDEVWNSIAAEVFPKKEERKVLWFWLGFGGILLLLAIAVFLENGKLGQSENINSKEETTKNLISKNNPKNNSISKSEIINTTPVGATKSETIFKTENISVNLSPSDFKSATKNNNTNTISQKLTDVEIIDNKFIIDKTSLTPSVEGKNILSNFPKTNVSTPLEWMNQRTKETIYMIPFSGLLLKEPLWVHPILNLPVLVDVENFPPEPTSLFDVSLGASAGATFWKHQISDKYTSDLSPFDFNYKDGNGWQTNLNLNISLGKKWDVFAGVQYEQVKTTSGHNSPLTYNPDDEMGDPLNGYVLSLATPYGLSGATFNFKRVEEIGTDAVDLLADFHSEHMIKNISIPVGAMFYPLGKKRKLVPAATLGFGVNYLQGISNEIGTIETNHSAIQFDDSGSSTFVDAEVKKWHYDFRVGVGLNYHLNRYFNLNLNYNFSKGINPVFEQDQYNTKIDRHHISLGVTTKISR